MLLMLRDLGITTQCLFALPEYVNTFASNKTNPTLGRGHRHGRPHQPPPPAVPRPPAHQRRHPPHHALDHPHRPTPTWNQPLSPNDKIELRGAHALQTFAFADGPRRSLILLNLSRTETIRIQLPAIPGPIAESRLTSAAPADTNELHATVIPTHRTITLTQPYQLPPNSLTTLTWTTR